MPPGLNTASLCVAAFLLGGVPFGLLLGRLAGVDIRELGSGNIGATNLTRALGRKWGIAAFVLDFTKGCIPVMVADQVVRKWPANFALAEGGWPIVLVGVAAIAGHIYPVYLGFRGGKGVSTVFGVVTACTWISALAAGVTWLALFRTTRIVSAASLAAAVVLPLSVFVLHRIAPMSAYPAVQSLTLAAAALVFYRHGSNIRRLMSGRELRFAPPPSTESEREKRGD